MLLVSQNVCRYFYHDEAVFRINMAWAYSYESLQKRVNETPGDVFLDVPIGRSKPGCPENKHESNASWIAYCNSKYFPAEFRTFVERNPKVKYVAVSNVDSADDLSLYLKLLGARCHIVPKIESLKAVENIGNILKALVFSTYYSSSADKHIMLDHDDLHVDLVAQGKEPKLLYSEYVRCVEAVCHRYGVKVLRAEGVIFSDDPIT